MKASKCQNSFAIAYGSHMITVYYTINSLKSENASKLPGLFGVYLNCSTNEGSASVEKNAYLFFCLNDIR